MDPTDQLNRSNEHLETNPAQATWGPVEQTLMDNVEGDVLVILDCCYASDIQRNLTHGNKSYEMLAASNRNNTTPKPGPKSFTSDLMISLRELLRDRGGNPFTTYDLLTKISPKRPIGQEPALHNRRFRIDTGTRSRHILLAPHKAQDEARTEGFPPHHSDVSDLTLAFELDKRSLDRDEIERLTSRLPRVFKQAKIPLRRFHFRGLEARISVRNHVHAITNMQRHLYRVRQKQRRALEAVAMANTVDTVHILKAQIDEEAAISVKDSKLAFIECPCPNQVATALPRHSQRLLDKKRSV